ncbi:uncharacterized protein C17orf50 homolog [Heteronotia binoei]|uniref:uncharacterized protein C17orf50 homolog n=1 Tax=Heteronotia binoei TaxID=13085 RepID=UPI00292FD4F7|nr:uncharacterized protein C17orf50 homolog [Heteronotia binoei]
MAYVSYPAEARHSGRSTGFMPIPMSESRLEEEEREKEDTHPQEELAAVETEAMAENSGCIFPTTSTEQAEKQDSWFWNWLSLSVLSGLTWLGDRNQVPQEAVCCCSERKPSGKMCPDCEIMFCKKCEKLHYSRAFIEHGLLGHHSADTPPRISSPARSTGSVEVAAIVDLEDNETKKL